MKKLILYLSVAALSAACARNPVTGKREIVLVSENQEIGVGGRLRDHSTQRTASLR
jgi:hypothetical protein